MDRRIVASGIFRKTPKLLRLIHFTPKKDDVVANLETTVILVELALYRPVPARSHLLKIVARLQESADGLGTVTLFVRGLIVNSQPANGSPFLERQWFKTIYKEPCVSAGSPARDFNEVDLNVC